MKLLVVGGGSFIGGHLLRAARAAGMTALGTRSRDVGAPWIPFDLARDRILDRIDRSFFAGPEPVAVVAAAAVTDMDRCLTDRASARRINVDHAIRLIEDVVSVGAKPVFLSTGHVFDGTQGYYTETDPKCPVNEYARQKSEVEDHLLSKVPGAFITRLDKVVGDNPAEHHLFSQWQGLLDAGQPIVCIEGMTVTPTWVDDVARGILLACERNLCGLYHIANPEFFTRYELALQFCRAAGRRPTVVTKPMSTFSFRDGRALKSYLDGTKFIRASGLHFATAREVITRFLRNVEARGAR